MGPVTADISNPTVFNAYAYSMTVKRHSVLYSHGNASPPLSAISTHSSRRFS